jgi:hypothetical protein
MPSKHGPPGIGVVFRADGAIGRVAATDAESEWGAEEYIVAPGS